MSELRYDFHIGSRQHLLTTASAVILAASLSLLNSAAVAGDEPPLWVELGYHSDQVRDSSEGFELPIGSIAIPTGLTTPLSGNLLLARSYGDSGRVIFHPPSSDWVFSASISYGRSSARKRGAVDYSKPIPTTVIQTYHTTIPTYPFPYHRTRTRPAQVRANTLHVDTLSAEKHMVLDFQVGRDVGLGLFGKNIESTLGIGVRVAQVKTSLTVANFRAVPDAHLTYFHSTFPTVAPFPSGSRLVPWYHTGQSQVWHDVSGNGDSSHEFVGIGPSVYWDASAPLWGDTDHGGEFSLTWGVNGALLFGRQKNKSSHQTIGNNLCYGRFLCDGLRSAYRNTSETRSEKRVTIPNLGGYIGFSYRLDDIKASFGYRSDFFFGALDTGLAAQRSMTRGFDGPFASVSIGLGN